MTSLVPDHFYWAKSGKVAAGRPTVVQVSTVFGDEREYWTFAVVGSEQHYMIGDFEILACVAPVEALPMRQAAE
jgi:hypothetical protein